ncbi:MAG: hypothetical protein PHZ23_15855, partial [Acidiphilium sp.]|nr:hypothetical protein [Acidiphilium sp.]
GRCLFEIQTSKSTQDGAGEHTGLVSPRDLTARLSRLGSWLGSWLGSFRAGFRISLVQRLQKTWSAMQAPGSIFRAMEELSGLASSIEAAGVAILVVFATGVLLTAFLRSTGIVAVILSPADMRVCLGVAVAFGCVRLLGFPSTRAGVESAVCSVGVLGSRDTPNGARSALEDDRSPAKS